MTISRDFSCHQKISSEQALYVGPKNSIRVVLLALANPDVEFYVCDTNLDEYNIDFLDIDSNRMLRRRLYLIEKGRDAQ